jgi:hypothetical protein
MERPPESLKAFADRIARAAESEEANQLVRMLRISGWTGTFSGHQIQHFGEEDRPTSVLACEPGVPPKQSRMIGIWERRIEDGKAAYVRRLDQMELWHFWANVGRIEPRSSKLRVLYVGESVARGFLYDPGYTPALVLQTILEEEYGKGHVEVIDLARTNLSFEMGDLSLAALQLEPDIAIFFAGNNWEKKTSLPTFADIARMEEAINTDGMVGVKRVFDEYIEKTGRKITSEVLSEYKSAGIPIIWIIPEFNLGDWREPFTSAPYLPDNRNAEWIAAMREARKALSEGDIARAEQFGAKLTEIDQGICSAGYYIVAECRRLANDIEGQRKYLELARDAQSWDDSIMYIPKNYEIAQQVLREEVPKYGGQLIDLPVLFKQYLNGDIPGNRLFLDYCHMTSEGIQISMAAAASCVLRALKGIERPWQSMIGDHIAPTPEVEAEASFLAAIHDAHRYQSYDMARHFCARAVKHSPHVAELMLNYIELQVVFKAPIRMSEAELAIFRRGSPLVQRYLFPNNNKRLDKLLLTAIVDALEEAGIPARERLAQRYREEHSTRLEQIDLLEPYYYLSAGQPHEFEGLNWPSSRVDYDPRYFRAFWPDSKFVFIGEAGLPVNLRMTCRLSKHSPDEGKISVDCNGTPQVEMTVNKEWSSWDIAVPGDVVHDGLNEIEVHWPIPTQFPTAEILNDLITRMCQLRYPQYYPIYGEIHAFSASSVAHAVESPHELEEVAVSQAVA